MRKTFILVVLFVAVGCTVKAYSGPERAKEEISEIHIRATGEITIESVRINENKYGGLGDSYQVLPGTQKIEISYRYEDRSMCGEETTLCFATVDYGTCSGSLTTLPGRPYLITVENYYALVKATVSAKGYFDIFERDNESEPGYVGCSSEAV